MASTITISNTSLWAQQFLRLRPLFVNANEPALTSGSLVMQAILGPPFRWRWNRARTAFFTSGGLQDYVVLKWRNAAAVSTGWQLVDSNGNSQICTTAGTTGGSQPSWNVTVGGNTSDNGVVWKNQGVPPGLTPSTIKGDPGNLCFIEHASMQSLSTDSPSSAWNPLDPKIALDLDSTQGPPRFIAAEGDDNLGDITFRLQPVPDATYPIAVTIQQKATLMQNTASTWAPIPDEFAYIYNWGFLALMMLYADDPRFPQVNQKFIAHLLGASHGLTATQINVFLNSWMAVTGQPVLNADRLTQGVQALGV